MATVTELFGKDITFLVCDDYQNIRETVIADLRKLGVTKKIFEAPDGEVAFKTLEGNFGTPDQIDFVISDLMMPKCTGLEFLALVRAEAKYKTLPFLMLTSENDRSQVMTAIQLGVSNYLLKPWKIEELTEKLGFCWKKHVS